MVHCVQDFAVEDFLQLFEIDNKAGAGIDFPFYGDLEGVIVTMSVGIVALAEDALVLFRGEFRVVIIVRGSKFGFTG